MEIVPNIAKNINKYRKDLSIEKVSRLADIPASTIWKIIRKEVRDVKVSTLLALGKAFNCSVDDLLK